MRCKAAPEDAFPTTEGVVDKYRYDLGGKI